MDEISCPCSSYLDDMLIWYPKSKWTDLARAVAKQNDCILEVETPCGCAKYGAAFSWKDSGQWMFISSKSYPEHCRFGAATIDDACKRLLSAWCEQEGISSLEELELKTTIESASNAE